MTTWLLRGGRVLDPGFDLGSAGTSHHANLTSAALRLDRAADVLIREGKIVEIGAGLALPAGAREVDCRDRWVVPGFVDLHTHLREPGHEYKEDIASGTRAAARGGFTTICAMANTQPVNDCRAVTELVARRAREVGAVRVFPIGAITQGLRGEALAEMAEMKEAGIVAVSDDGNGVMNAEVMRRAMEYARTFDLTLIQHCEDRNLSAGGVMNESAAATRIGLRGQPSAAEAVMVARDLILAELTGARYHVAHVSTKESVRLLRDARRRGCTVTSEVTPHHLTLTEVACCNYDTATKVAPPLRSAADLQALHEALADGTIDCIATDHAPHSLVEKEVEFDGASFGMVGLETAFPLVLELITAGTLSIAHGLRLLTASPVSVVGLPKALGRLTVGGPADIAVIDPAAEERIDRAALLSKSKNTPFHGRVVKGRVELTLCAGKIAYSRTSEWTVDSPGFALEEKPWSS